MKKRYDIQSLIKHAKENFAPLVDQLPEEKENLEILRNHLNTLDKSWLINLKSHATDILESLSQLHQFRGLISFFTPYDYCYDLTMSPLNSLLLDFAEFHIIQPAASGEVKPGKIISLALNQEKLMDITGGIQQKIHFVRAKEALKESGVFTQLDLSEDVVLTPTETALKNFFYKLNSALTTAPDMQINLSADKLAQLKHLLEICKRLFDNLEHEIPFCFRDEQEMCAALLKNYFSTPTELTSAPSLADMANLPSTSSISTLTEEDMSRSSTSPFLFTLFSNMTSGSRNSTTPSSHT